MPTTTPYSFLDETARSNPEAIALVTPSTTYTFAQLRAATRNIAGVLRENGIRAGDIVATKLSADREWLLTLALLHEGVVTCSVWEESHADLARASLLITDTSLADPSVATPRLVIDQKWILRAAAEDNAYEPVPFAGDDAVVRLVLTSGTTGTPKLVSYTLGLIAWRNANRGMFSTPGDYLNLLGAPTMGAFYHAIGHLSTAKPRILLDTIDERAAHLIVEHGINVILGSPLSIEALCDVFHGLDESTSVAVTDAIRGVIIVGSTPSDRLIETIREQFGVDARLVYGSTEGGALTNRVVMPGEDPRIVGRPNPGVSIDIVDENDTAVAPGVTGLIRYKSFDLVKGYFRDPAATALAFRDGWFYPGDRGSLTADGQLMLAGRTDEVLNVGGVKLDPLEIDRAVMALPGVLDAAAFVFESLASSPRLAVAIVGDASLDLAFIDAEMRRLYPTRYPSVYVTTDAIPRNAAGKILRSELDALFAHLMDAADPA